MNIEKLAQKVVGEHGILKTVKVEATPADPNRPSFEAFTDMKNNETTLRYNPEFKVPKSAEAFAKEKGISQPLEDCVRDIITHECGHIHNRKRQGCPETFDEHMEHFYNPISDVLKRTGKEGATGTVSNLAEDLINNTLLAHGQNHQGLSLFYKEAQEKGNWNPGFEAYMMMQMHCWGDDADKQMLKPNLSLNPFRSKKVKTAVDGFINTLNSVGAKKGNPTQKEIADYFAQKDNWQQIAQDFTEAIEPLIPRDMTKDMKMPKKCAFGKQMEKAMEDPTNREKMARKAYDKGQEAPSWMEKEEALDAVYTSLARNIPITADSPRRAMAFPIVPHQYAPFDPEDHSVADIDFMKPVIVPEQETAFGIEALTFGVPERFIEGPILVKKGLTSFPEFKCAYVDCSISMTEGLPGSAGSVAFIPWGDNSKYHYLCKAWYGIVEYLARQGILPNVNVSLGSFSDTSRVNHGLEESKRLLFNPKFGGTSMDLRAIDKLFEGGKSVFFTVSDGEVWNWNEVRDSFIDKAREHLYFHIQLGPHSEMTRDLKRAGLSVYTVSKGSDLETLAVDLTKKAYHSYMDEALGVKA